MAGTRPSSFAIRRSNICPIRHHSHRSVTAPGHSLRKKPRPTLFTFPWGRNNMASTVTNAATELTITADDIAHRLDGLPFLPFHLKIIVTLGFGTFFDA